MCTFTFFLGVLMIQKSLEMLKRKELFTFTATYVYLSPHSIDCLYLYYCIYETVNIFGCHSATPPLLLRLILTFQTMEHFQIARCF